MADGRRQNAQEFLDGILKPYYPGFKNARLRVTAPVVGVRETRKIVGEYTLTVEGCKGASFPDTIALTGYGWDLPDPKRPSYQPFHTQFWGKDVPFRRPYSEIPYRCLVPKASQNLLVAGRRISVDDQAFGPVRVMPPCYAMGQAVGTAAAMCVRGGYAPAQVPVQDLRASLLAQGAVLS